ncbi:MULTISPECIES: M20/M25/M40 family metallo-hydrolase [Bifidobacterium]|uniref:Peptidase M20 n=1 Tax=Bifidobacterium ruminantium TaxID=78346 RepID=A0A087D1V3_BIFRU|nr:MULTISPECIES: M20/M25/M40 family metallo-hydrolase [Bifidobacterium]KFI89503.1 peptidase M20 [Bifidobacterium ruminantium]
MTDANIAADEVVRLLVELIRIDTRNGGMQGEAKERPAAEWAAELLTDVGLAPRILESRPGRANLIVDIPGENHDLPVLLLHGHLDTVAANNSDWTVDPVGGEIKSDGIAECVWGRGAVDMKDMVAMTLAAIRAVIRRGKRPKRDVRVILFADEEAGGFAGSEWIGAHHPEWFDRVGYIISETGGFSSYVNGKRVYYVQVGEKGTQWFKIAAQGTQSHGSQINYDNAVVKVARAATRVAEYQWPVELNPVTKLLLERLGKIAAINIQEPGGVERIVDATGFARPWIASTIRNTYNVSSLDAGSSVNIVPATAEGLIDGRALPGQEDHVLETLRSLVGKDAQLEAIHRSTGYLSDPNGDLFDYVEHLIADLDPEAAVVPFLSSGGTDSKAILKVVPDAQVLGFIPLRIPEGFNYIANFHGVDERVPLESVRFGETVLERLIVGL